PTGDGGNDGGDQADEGIRLWRQHGDNARWLENAEVKMRGSNWVHTTKDLLILICPTCIVNQPVDGCCHFYLRIVIVIALFHHLSDELSRSAFEHLGN